MSALNKLQLNEVKIGLEATSIYGDGLLYALREDGQLGHYQRKIHVLNLRQVCKFKEAYPDLPKNDSQLRVCSLFKIKDIFVSFLKQRKYRIKNKSVLDINVVFLLRFH